MKIKHGWLVGWMMAAMIATVVTASARPDVGDRQTCQIMDRFLESLIDAEAAYLGRADVGDSGRAGFLELGTRANMAYFRLPFGDIDVRSRIRGIWIVDSGDIDLPNQLFMAKLPLTWVGRFDDGVSARLTIKPGYFGDGEKMTADAIFIPLAVSMVRALADDLSIVAGLEYRSGFERRWFPVFGSVWQPHPALRIEAMLPRGMVSLAPSRDWRFNVGYAWESNDYHLNDPRRRINFEDFRLTLGMTRVMHAEMELTAEIGYAMERRMTFHRSPGERMDMDDTFFIRFGVAAPF